MILEPAQNSEFQQYAFGAQLLKAIYNSNLRQMGGNCVATVPGKLVEHNGVTVIGQSIHGDV